MISKLKLLLWCLVLLSISGQSATLTFILKNGSGCNLNPYTSGMPRWTLRVGTAYYADGIIAAGATKTVTLSTDAGWYAGQCRFVGTYGDYEETVYGNVDYNGSVTLTLTGEGSTTCKSVPPVITSRASIQNIDSIEHTYGVYTNGVLDKIVRLAPGDTLTATYTGETLNQVAIFLMNSDFTPQGAAVAIGSNTTNGEPGTATSPISGANSGAVYSGGTGNISGNSDVGSSAVYDALVKGFQEIHSDIKSQPVPSNAGVESKLSEISAKLSTAPGQPSTSDQKTAGEAAGAEGKAKFDEMLDVPGGTVDPGSAGDQEWTIGAGNWSINLDPFAHSWVNALAAVCRGIIAWGSYLGLLWSASHTVLGGVTMSGTWRQASSAGTSVAGTSLGTPLALACAVIITVALGVLPATAVMVLHSYYPHLTTVIPPAGHAAISWSIYALQQFIPVIVLSANLLNALTFRWMWTGIIWLVATVIRFIVG